MRRLVGFILLSLTALALPAAAAEFNAVQAEKSTLVFSYMQMNVGMNGRFRKFAVQMSFDPDKAESAKVGFDVDLASIDTGFPEGDQEIADKQWFNTAAFPTAHFASTRITVLDRNRAEVAGQLTIKGHTQAVTVPASVTMQGDQATFDGSFVLKRADFAIGEGPWADFGIVANEIQVTFHILANRTK